MTTKEAKKLKVGDKVVFSDGVEGTVTETNWMAIKVVWCDGQVGTIHHGDMAQVRKVRHE
jgi:preprotein translocase subunit YajC